MTEAAIKASRSSLPWRIARVVVAVGVATCVLVGAIVTAAFHNHLRDVARAGTERTARDFATFDRAFSEDRELAASLPFFHFGRRADAAPYLNGRLRWGTLPEPNVSQPPEFVLDSSLRNKLAGVVKFEEPDIDLGVHDPTWMKALLAFDHWSIDAHSPLGSMEPYDLFAGPMPDFMDLVGWAKLRLIHGYRNGDRGASAEVQHLAMLCWSTETLIGEMIALAILANERSYREALAARADGTMPEGRALTVEEGRRLRRAAFAAFTYASQFAPDDYRRRIDGSSPIDCAAIHEVLVGLLRQRVVAQPLKPDWYLHAERQLTEVPCRMTALRRSWLRPPTDSYLFHGCDPTELAPAVRDYCSKMKVARYLPWLGPLALEATEGGPEDGFSGFAGYR